MVAPLGLFLGLLASQGMLKRYQTGQAEARQAAISEQLAPLFGAVGQEQAGPPAEGETLAPLPGSGLLGAPTDPAAQLNFAKGVLAIPELRQQGLQLVQQFTQQAGQREGQREQLAQAGLLASLSRAQQQGQFAQEFGLRQSESIGRAAQQEREFGATQAWRQQQAGFEQQRLGLDRSRTDAAIAASEAAAGASRAKVALPFDVPAGFEPYRMPDGSAGVRPIPGSARWTEAKAEFDNIGAGLGAADTLLTNIYGKLQTDGPMAGQRYGGSRALTGKQAGENAAAYQQLRRAVLSASGEGKNLSDEEQKQFERSLSNPTDWFALRGSKQKAQLDYWRGFLAKRQQSFTGANPWLLPPGFVPADGGK